jgi:alpha-glucoside transport system permease protein
VFKIINALLWVVGGVAGTAALFAAMNWLVDRLPLGAQRRIRPYVFIGPALLVVGIFLVYPAVLTIISSVLDDDAESFVGLSNYTAMLTDAGLRSAVLNNLLWIAVVPVLAVAVGLAVAVLADRLGKRLESVSKSIIFTPMAISAVGASTIWGFVYDWNPPGRDQIGVLNAIWTGIGGLVSDEGFQPISWLQVSQGRLNSFLLMIIMVWLQAGFAMVLLSAAIKGVPTDTLEAARIDGANEWQIFWRITVPQIRSTIAVVYTTIVIAVLKVFDIVYVLTGGNFNTDVIANRFIIELFDFRRFGRGSAIVVALMIATVPVMIYNVRQFRAQEAG